MKYLKFLEMENLMIFLFDRIFIDGVLSNFFVMVLMFDCFFSEDFFKLLFVMSFFFLFFIGVFLFMKFVDLSDIDIFFVLNRVLDSFFVWGGLVDKLLFFLVVMLNFFLELIKFLLLGLFRGTTLGMMKFLLLVVMLVFVGNFIVEFCFFIFMVLIFMELDESKIFEELSEVIVFEVMVFMFVVL